MGKEDAWGHIAANSCDVRKCEGSIITPRECRLLCTTPFTFHLCASPVVSCSVTQDVDPGHRLQLSRVKLIRGPYWSMQPWYRNMHTKYEAWNLPCKRVAFMDYDGFPLRNLDSGKQKRVALKAALSGDAAAV